MGRATLEQEGRAGRPADDRGHAVDVLKGLGGVPVISTLSQVSGHEALGLATGTHINDYCFSPGAR
jgi:hypothetical protein